MPWWGIALIVGLTAAAIVLGLLLAIAVQASRDLERDKWDALRERNEACDRLVELQRERAADAVRARAAHAEGSD